MISGFEIVSTKTATPRKCVHCHQPIVRDKDNGGLGFTYHHKETNQQWGPEPSILGDDSHYAEPHDGYSAEEMHSRTAALTLTAKEVGYYVVSRNGVPISGPYATRSDAAPNMIEQRGAAVMFIGPGNSAEWDSLKAKTFPVGSNTVNGSKQDRDWDDDEDPWAGEQHTASSYGQPQPAANRAHKFVEDPRWGDESSCVRCGQPKGDVSHTDRAQATTAGSMQERYIDGQRLASLRHTAEDQAYCRGCGLFGAPTHGSLCWQCKEKRSNGQPIEWRRTDKPKPRNHKASLEALAWGPDQHNPEVGLDFHEFPEDPEYIDPHSEDEIYDDDDEEEWDVPQRWEAARRHKFVEDKNWGDESSCMTCGKPKGDNSHTDRAQATSLLEERYATVRRLSSLRHFAEDEDELGYEKQPKGLGDQVDTGMAPSSEIQDPNPLAGQDLERVPRNLAEAARMYAAWDCETGGPCNWTPGRGSCPLCGQYPEDNPDYPQDTPHDQLDDPWNGQENPLGRGWGDPPLGY